MTTSDLWKQINPFLTRLQGQSNANHLDYITFFTRRVNELIIVPLEPEPEPTPTPEQP